MIKTKIEWCDSTWNPVTGCYHDCKYCYARGIANRFATNEWKCNNCYDSPACGLQNQSANCYRQRAGVHEIEAKEYIFNPKRYQPYPFGFEPTLHRYRLSDYKNKKPQTIFVCSMSDLFGEWVPDNWIEEVLDACREAPQHTYLFLTKNPKRYVDLMNVGILRDQNNFFYGTTNTKPYDSHFISNIDNKFNAFISIEPIQESWEKIYYTKFNGIDWIIIGAETGNRKNKVIPKKEWIEEIVDICKRDGVPVFMKDNLKPYWDKELIKEFPWEVEDESNSRD